MYRLKRKGIAMMVIMLCMVTCTVLAQGGLSFREVEDTTYALYLKGDWRELQKVGREALRQKIDYFYLRERMGIAYYMQLKYQLASPQFEKAYRFNSGDELNNEYLFYSYAFDGRYNDALKLSRHFSGDLKSKTKTTKPAPVNMALLEFTTKIPGDRSVAQPFYFITFGFNHRISRGYSAFHAYSYSQQKYTRGIWEEHRYYLSGNITLPKGFSLNPAFSVISHHYTDSIFGQPQPPQRPRLLGVNKQSFLSFIGSLNVSKVLPYVRLDLTNAFSNLDTTYQLQHSLGLTVYPLANQKLALSATAMLYTNDYYKTVSPVLQAGLRFNEPQFFALGVVYTYANVYNF
ncbi:MAG TPA: hypothetical protein VK174_10160, partial [Chitinophagales bacterium]|nr:hypothetical protein [Chitinophagales bacterium]